MKTVLILDIDSAQQKSMNHHFSQLGFAVRSIFSVAEFESISEKPFMIVLDEKMVSESRSGLQFLKWVKRKMSGVPVIYMVNKPESKNVAEAIKAGAYQVIEKNSAAFVNLRTALDKLTSQPPRTSWFARLFMKKTDQNLPALSM
jgi:DNA-binding NtrC family response regulator